MNDFIDHDHDTHNNALQLHQPVHAGALTKPEARVNIHIRKAIPGDQRDFDFIDALQKKHSKAVGFQYRQTYEVEIAKGNILIAEGGNSAGKPLGFMFARNRYMKRNDTMLIVQLAVAESEWRSLIGASLVRGLFDQAHYSCTLCSLWCAQDLAANHFWESLGFRPLAFRAGSEKKRRIHIYWQKRIREHDEHTPYWYPSYTDGGAVREGRLAIPLLPGMHWSDAKPLVLPDVPEYIEIEADEEQLLLEGADGEGQNAAKVKSRKKSQRKKDKVQPTTKPIQAGMFQFESVVKKEEEADRAAKKASKKNKKAAKVKRVYHPEYLDKARELSARFMEEVNSRGDHLVFDTSVQKYDVTRQLEGGVGMAALGYDGDRDDYNDDDIIDVPLLDAA
ncbi:MAG: GNAT family N-acetyltransferase [Phycisphaerales bacterium]